MKEGNRGQKQVSKSTGDVKYTVNTDHRTNATVHKTSEDPDLG